MTVSSTALRADAVGNGSTATFPFTFPVQAASELTVITRDLAGVETALVYLTDYTVTLATSGEGGDVVLTAGNLTSGYAIAILPNEPTTQETSVRNQGAYFPDQAESDLDRGTIRDKQLQEQADRSLHLPRSEAGSAAKTTLPFNRASAWLAFNASKEPIAATGYPDASPTTAFGASLIDDASAAAARATLGFPSAGNLSAVVATVAALKALATTDLVGDVLVEGYGAAGDGGGGVFRWNSSDTATDNAGTIIAPNAGGTGRWNRLGGYDTVVNVRAFAAKGDGVTDDTAAFVAALALAGTSASAVYVPSGTYKITTGLTVPANVGLIGANRRTTTIRKAANIDLVTLADSATLRNLYLDGNAAAGYTGRLIAVTASSGGQGATDCTLTNSDGYVIEYLDNLSGSRSFWINCDIARYNGNTAGRYAVKIPAVSTLSATPRTFVGVQTLGQKFIDLGGCNDLFIGQSFVGEILFNAVSRGVNIVGSRIGVNETTMNVAGFGVNIVGCDVAPSMTVLAGTTPCVIDSFCNGTIVDHSASSNNLINIPGTQYTPTWTGASANPTLGNGDLRGFYSRSGATVTLAVELTIGSTTAFNACGLFQFAVPIAAQLTGAGSSPQVQIGHGYVRQSSTATFEFVEPVLVTASGNVILQRAGAGGPQVTHLAPWTWTTGDIVRFTITYNV